ncbi:MAG TPA: hypothetical protein VM581_00220 [Magnetospirillaceae bacterium]|nr:hypothetical protein [Magnetospirillaceae bacterium]
MNKQLSDILQRRMDRKDFLKHVGMGMVVLTGLAGVIKVLKPQEQAKSSKQVASGYGASVYGGGQIQSTKS